jgi:aspartate racemase
MPVVGHLGIVGVSPEGVALLYRLLSRHGARLLPANHQPRISVHNEPLETYISAIRGNDWDLVGKHLRRSAELLARCGAGLCLTPDNAVQHGVQLAEVGSPVPWLSIPELVGNVLVADGRKTVGIIGTKLVMLSSTYQTPLGLKGLHLRPPTPEQVDRIDRIIFDELIYGYARPESEAFFEEVLRNLAERGCDCVVIASSELPLVVRQERSALPIYDSTDILALEAIRRCGKAEAVAG